MSGPMNRTSLELFRDCLRLVRHVAPGDSPKALALRQTVRQQFRAQRDETCEAQIEAAKASAVRALSNYMLYQSAQKDSQLRQAMKDQVRNLNSENSNERRERGDTMHKE